MFQVRKLSEEDFGFAVNLTDTMGWQQTEDDFRFMLEMEPEGCFILLYNSEKVGIVTNVSFGKVGWLGNLIVNEKHRKKEGGRLLVQRSIEYFKSRGVETVGLFAYLDTLQFYRKLGFSYDSEFVVLHGKGFNSPSYADVRRADENDAVAIVNLDCLCFGGSREKLLKPLLQNRDNICYVSYLKEQIYGYAMAKVYWKTAEVGPLMCKQGLDDLAVELLRKMFSELQAFEVSLCVPQKEIGILRFLREHGFSEKFRVARMFLGLPNVKECIYIPESLERG